MNIALGRVRRKTASTDESKYLILITNESTYDLSIILNVFIEVSFW